MPSPGGKIKWFAINWSKASDQVKRCQMDIAVAYISGNMTKVKVLQNKLVNSFSRKRIVVKTVSSNKGKNMAGVDVLYRIHRSTNIKPFWISNLIVHIKLNLLKV